MPQCRVNRTTAPCYLLGRCQIKAAVEFPTREFGLRAMFWGPDLSIWGPWAIVVWGPKIPFCEQKLTTMISLQPTVTYRPRKLWLKKPKKVGGGAPEIAAKSMSDQRRSLREMDCPNFWQATKSFHHFSHFGPLYQGGRARGSFTSHKTSLKNQSVIHLFS